MSFGGVLSSNAVLWGIALALEQPFSFVSLGLWLPLNHLHWMCLLSSACRQLQLFLWHTDCWVLTPRGSMWTVWKSNTFMILGRVPSQEVEKSISGSAVNTESRQRCSHSCVPAVCLTSVKLGHHPRGAVTSKGESAVESYWPWSSVNSIQDSYSKAYSNFR